MDSTAAPLRVDCGGGGGGSSFPHDGTPPDSGSGAVDIVTDERDNGSVRTLTSAFDAMALTSTVDTVPAVAATTPGGGGGAPGTAPSARALVAARLASLRASVDSPKAAADLTGHMMSLPDERTKNPRLSIKIAANDVIQAAVAAGISDAELKTLWIDGAAEVSATSRS